MKKFLVALTGLAGLAALIVFFFAPTFSGANEVIPALQIGTFNLRYYGLILGLAVVSVYFIARSNAWRFGVGREDVDKYSFWLILVAFISARIYFVLFDLQYFMENPGQIIQIWNGGMSIFGAILGGVLFTFLYARKKAYSAWQLLDLTALALPLGQMIGRFGNFFNYEAYGLPTNLPWKMYVPEAYRYSTFEEFYHPTFLYEALGNLVLFIILFLVRGRLKSGNLILFYLLGYSALRFVIEPLRVDSVYMYGFRVDQMVALAVFLVAGITLLNRKRLQSKKT